MPRRGYIHTRGYYFVSIGRLPLLLQNNPILVSSLCVHGIRVYLRISDENSNEVRTTSASRIFHA